MINEDYHKALNIYDNLSDEEKLDFKHYVLFTWPHLNKDILAKDYILETLDDNYSGQ